MEDDLTRALREEGTPFIGVIGATSPRDGYDEAVSRKIGFRLRELVQDRAGTIFTGGVEGVGVDTYVGVLQYCVLKTDMKEIHDRFFVLVPHFILVEQEGERGMESVLMPYHPPATYTNLAKVLPAGELCVKKAGKTMVERREYLSSVADALVAINGGPGTLDEAFICLQQGKPVIAVKGSGGAADLLAQMKSKTLPSFVKHQLKQRGIDIDISLEHLTIASADTLARTVRSLLY